jgi:hypothetical protein
MDEFHVLMGGMTSNKEEHIIIGKEAIKTATWKRQPQFLA